MADTPKAVLHTGLFNIGTGLPGAPHLQAVLTVLPASSIVLGHGLLGQATNPPLHIASVFHGVVHALGFGTAHQVFALNGSAADPRLIGAPHVTQLLITLDGIWGNKGTATYTYVNGSDFHEIKEVPVSVEWLAT